jgi:general secretion pathway protein C
MENFLRKYGWVLSLALIGVAAFLLALTVNNIVSSQLAPYTVPEMVETEDGAQQGPAQQPTRNRSDRWTPAIAQRCLFGCSEEPPADECPGGCEDDERCEEGQCVPVDDEPEVASDVPQASELNMKLLGAMVAAQPDYSMALIKNEDINQTLVVGVGDLVTDGAEIIEIRRDRVLIERNGQIEYIRMDKTIGADPSATTATATAPRRPSVSPRPAPRAKKPSGNAVKKVDDDKFRVERDAIDKHVQDRKQLARQGRVVPNIKDGEREGLKMVGISPDSVYTQLGIQSGDVLRSVNGKKVNSSHQAMELFEAMKDRDSVTVEIERRGQKKRIQYDVR